MKHPAGRAAVLATIVGALLAGWALGAWTTCGTECRFDVDLFGAWGTWLGSLTGAAAVFYAAFQIREDARARNRERRELLATRLAIAQSCKLAVKPSGLGPQGYTKVHASFTNKTSMPITDLVISLDDTILGSAPLNLPGANPFGVSAPIAKIGLTKPLDPQTARTYVSHQVKPLLVFEFTVGTTRFRRTGSVVKSVTET